MSYITTQNETNWTADLAIVNAQIAALGAASIDAVARGTRSYLFNSGTGDQRQTFESPLIMLDSMDRLTKKRDLLQRLLNGRAIVRSQFRP